MGDLDNTSAQQRSTKYTYLSYVDIVKRLNELSEKYPDICKVYTAQEKYNLPTAGVCAEGSAPPIDSNKCKQYFNDLQNTFCLSVTQSYLSSY